MTEPTEQRRSWVSQWVRSEDFWRDVFARTLSGTFAGLVLALLAAIAAWAYLPEVRPTLAFWVSVIVSIAVAGAILVAWSRWWGAVYGARTRGTPWMAAGVSVAILGTLAWCLILANVLNTIGEFFYDLVA